MTITVVDARDNRPLAANVQRVTDAQGRDVDTSPMFRFSGSPTQLTEEARSWPVRCKRLFGGGSSRNRRVKIPHLRKTFQI